MKKEEFINKLRFVFKKDKSFKANPFKFWSVLFIVSIIFLFLGFLLHLYLYINLMEEYSIREQIDSSKHWDWLDDLDQLEEEIEHRRVLFDG